MNLRRLRRRQDSISHIRSFIPHHSLKMNIYAKSRTKMHKYTILCFLHFFTQHLLIFLQSVSKHTLIAYTFQSWYLSFAKPMVLGPETLGFTLKNPWFRSLKPRLSDCNLMGFRKRFRYCINIQNWSPAPAPRWEQPHPQPLPVGEGSEYPCFLLEDGARRPPSYWDLPC